MNKKKLLAFGLLLLVAIASMVVYQIADFAKEKKADEGENDRLEQVYALFGLKLLDGSPSGFELERQPTRAEGAVMLTRMAGGERNVKSQPKQHSFTDVPTWAEGYINFVYNQNLVKGISNTLFSPSQQLDLKSYLTFIMRVLGYSDAEGGDFTWNDAPEYAVKIGLLSKNKLKELQQEEFSRGVMLEVSFAALHSDVKGEGFTLAEQLIKKGVFDRRSALIYGVIPQEKRTADDEAVLAEVAKSEERPLTERLVNTDYFIYNRKNCAEVKKLMDDVNSDFALINRSHVLNESYIPELVDTDELPTTTGNVQLRAVMLNAMKVLFEAAENSGVTLYTNSGYRSYKTQTFIYGDGSDIYVAPPGASEHQTGLALDVVGSQKALDVAYTNSSEAAWIRQNSYKYGLLLRYPEGMEGVTGYPGEWWHMRYIGKAIAFECQKHDMVLEEFYQIISEK